MNRITVDRLQASPLVLAAVACRMSHDSHEHSDSTLDFITNKFTCGPKDAALIERVGNKFKHASILEQLVYHFHIDGISRACLQELARHRAARLTVKSTRYTLKELKDEPYFLEGWAAIDTLESANFNADGYNRAINYLVMTDNPQVNLCAIGALDNVIELLNQGMSNDVAKYALPEAYRTELVWQIDGRNLQNFLRLRTAKDALPEIRLLANKIYDELPDDHKYLYTDCVVTLPEPYISAFELEA